MHFLIDTFSFKHIILQCTNHYFGQLYNHSKSSKDLLMI